MPIHFTCEFIKDLTTSTDARFIRQVLKHTITPDGQFVPNRDDHRYQGIPDAWIRYVSKGASAFRVIFIRQGVDIYLYRAGPHAIEQRLREPLDLASSVDVSEAYVASALSGPSAQAIGCLLKTTEAKFIGKHIQAMYHVRHHEICLVSPFIDYDILGSNHPFGRFLDKAVEEGTIVSIITTAAHPREALPVFKRLEERGVLVYFLPGLHTKLYFFDVDMASRNTWQKGVTSQAIVGSSNLTNAGLGLSDAKANEELNCQLAPSLIEEARRYTTRLMNRADDFPKHNFNIHRRSR